MWFRGSWFLARICYILETSVEYHRMGGTSVWSKRKLEFGSLLQFFIIIIIIIRMGCDSGQQGGALLFNRKLTCWGCSALSSVNLWLVITYNNMWYLHNLQSQFVLCKCWWNQILKTRFGFRLFWRSGGDFLGLFWRIKPDQNRFFSTNHNKVTTNCPQTKRAIEKWWYFFRVKNQFSSLFVKHHDIYDKLFLFLFLFWFPKCKNSLL